MSKVKITKLPLGDFIDALIQVYNSGADFIDLLADTGEVQDNVGILVREEYVNKNRTDEESYVFGFEDDAPHEQANIKALTDDEINQLLKDE